MLEEGDVVDGVFVDGFVVDGTIVDGFVLDGRVLVGEVDDGFELDGRVVTADNVREFNKKNSRICLQYMFFIRIYVKQRYVYIIYFVVLVGWLVGWFLTK